MCTRFRSAPLQENLDLFEKMRVGRLEEGEATLRLKMDMTSPNPNMWDQVTSQQHDTAFDVHARDARCCQVWLSATVIISNLIDVGSRLVPSRPDFSCSHVPRLLVIYQAADETPCPQLAGGFSRSSPAGQNESANMLAFFLTFVHR